MSEFRKTLNLFDSTSIVIGSMIGSGIFIVSADMSRQLGSPGWLLITWIITGIMTIIAALSYGELASMFPKAGGQYIYLREAYNPLFGFLYGWALFLVIQTGTIAAVAMAFAKFVGVLLPWISEANVWFSFKIIKFNFSKIIEFAGMDEWFQRGVIHLSTVHITAIASIILLTYLNTKGIRIGKYIQNSFTITKLLLVLAFIVIGLFLAKDTGAISINKNIFWDAEIYSGENLIKLQGFALIAAIGAAMVGSLFSSDAWNNITFAGAEIINPKRNLPLSLFLGTLIVTIIYILVNIVYLQVLPLRGNVEATDFFGQGIQYASNDRLGTATMSGIFGEYAAMLMAVFIVFSTFGCNNGLILAGARVYFAMAENKLFFKNVGKLNKSGVPANGLIIQCFWASLLCLSGSYGELLDYVVFAVLVFYVLTIAGIFIMRYKLPNMERPYKVIGYPFIPSIYIFISCIIMVILLIYKPVFTWPGLIIILLGIPVYYLWKLKSNKKQENT